MSTPLAAPEAGGDRPWRAWCQLGAVSGLALTVFRLDTGIYDATAPYAPWVALAADLRLTSLLLLTALVVTTGARTMLGRPTRPDWRVLRWAGLWLFGCFIAVHDFGIGRIPLLRWQDVFAFSVTGVLAEELLNRGLVLTAAHRLWPPGGTRPGRAVIVSAVVFALMHLQYHGFRTDGAAWLQVAWTFPLGILLAWLTERTRSLWPATILHLLNNVLVQVA